MEKEFVTYEIALALKELGFNKKCLGHFNTHQGDKWLFSIDLSGEGQYPSNSRACLAPTYSQAFRFFREKYGLFHNIISEDPAREDVYWYGYVFGKTPNRRDIRIRMIKTYEETELACLIKLIEIVKEKK